MKRLLTIAALSLTAVGLAPNQAECAYCISGTYCMSSRSCSGSSCVCLKKNLSPSGECVDISAVPVGGEILGEGE